MRLNIADTIIDFSGDLIPKGSRSINFGSDISKRVSKFIYNGQRRADILIAVRVGKKTPQLGACQPLFSAYHVADASVSWQMDSCKNRFVYRSNYRDKTHLIVINKSFDRATVHLTGEIDDGPRCVFDIIYSFLQVLLLNYFAIRKSGVFVHAMGLKDPKGRGILFLGESGRGKTTLARIWHAHSKAAILNDDKMIIRRRGTKFMIYSSPWHGDFWDYLSSRETSAPLEKMFFIYHSAKNTPKEFSKQEAFRWLWPVIFFPFWNKQQAENILSLCHGIVNETSCSSLGFVNTREAVDAVMKTCNN